MLDAKTESELFYAIEELGLVEIVKENKVD